MPDKKDVAFFVTCLIDNLRPEIGFSVVTLLEKNGFNVVVPEAQSCCGQPNYNGGDPLNARKIARHFIDIFMPYDYIVAASGSCAGMVIHHYPTLFANDPEYQQKATILAKKVFELSCFLTDVVGFEPAKTKHSKITFHDACAGLRELGVKQQPRKLLKQAGYEIAEMNEAEACCGFGGTFCVKYPEISTRMLDKKIINAAATGAEILVTGDLGCMLNLEGRLNRQGSDLRVCHFAELLADADY
ncbi:MAG: (Fe-S)-binding protein [Pseudomonadales bacterium]|nr:(Fe-S)-binding protein [Pseudomonadales bacterium]